MGGLEGKRGLEGEWRVGSTSGSGLKRWRDLGARSHGMVDGV